MDSLLPLDVKIDREYDPMWPNDYEKVVKEMRSKRRGGSGDQEEEEEDSKGDKKRRYLVQSMDGARKRFQQASGQSQQSFPGFSARPGDEEEESSGGSKRGLGSGAAIAPPPSLTILHSLSHPLSLHLSPSLTVHLSPSLTPCLTFRHSFSLQNLLRNILFGPADARPAD